MIIKIIFIFMLTAIAGYVYAQSIATPIQLGFLSATGCPSGQNPCWLPYSSTNPMPVTSN